MASVDACAAALVREYLSRKGYKQALAAPMPSVASLSETSPPAPVLWSALQLQPLVKQNRGQLDPVSTLLELVLVGPRKGFASEWRQLWLGLQRQLRLAPPSPTRTLTPTPMLPVRSCGYHRREARPLPPPMSLPSQQAAPSHPPPPRPRQAATPASASPAATSRSRTRREDGARAGAAPSRSRAGGRAAAAAARNRAGGRVRCMVDCVG